MIQAPSKIYTQILDTGHDLGTKKHWVNYLKKDERDWDAEIIGNSLWVSEKNVKDIFLGEKVFFHYDEVYFLSTKPTFDVHGHFTTDNCFFNKKVPDEFIENFKKINATRFLSDGGGLNFVCESLDLVESIRKVEKL